MPDMIVNQLSNGPTGILNKSLKESSVYMHITVKDMAHCIKKSTRIAEYIL